MPRTCWTTDTASSASFLDLYLEFDDSGQISTKIYDKRDDFNFKIINFRNMCSNIPASRNGIYCDKILVSEYKLFKRSNKANLCIALVVACFSDEDDVSGNQNNCYWPLHSQSIARCKHHKQATTRAIQRFALFDLLKSLYSDTKILSQYIPFLQKRL
jgi:hypothetical protein